MNKSEADEAQLASGWNFVLAEENNAMEDEQFVIEQLLQEHFSVTPEGKIDMSKPLYGFTTEKLQWMPADPLTDTTFAARTTYIGRGIEVWFQPKSNARQIEQIENEVNHLCHGTAPPISLSDWENGDICLAQYHLDRKWYRAVIRETFAKPNYHLIRFVDYGNEEFVDNNQLRLANGMTMRPVQAHVGYFDNLAPIGDRWLTSQVEEIHQLLADEEVHLKIRYLVNNFIGIQSMTIMKNGKDALTEIVNCGLGSYRSQSIAVSNEVVLDVNSNSPATFYNQINSDESITQPIISVLPGAVVSLSEDNSLDASPLTNWLKLYETNTCYELLGLGFKLMTIPPEINDILINITSIVDANLFMVQVAGTRNKELKRIQNAYNALVDTMQHEAKHQPCLDQPYLYDWCCCKYDGDGRWYRGVVVEDTTREDSCLSIQFVDYGNIQKSPTTEVRKLKNDWFSVPAQAIPCTIEGFKFRRGLSASEAMDHLGKNLIGKPYVKAIIKKREKNLSIECYNKKGDLLYQPLIDDEILVSTRQQPDQ